MLLSSDPRHETMTLMRPNAIAPRIRKPVRTSRVNTAGRARDVLVGATLLTAAAPVLAAAAVALRVGGTRPVLWRSTRLGRHGRPFTLLMLRTMRDDAAVPPAARLSPVGRALRAVSLDHLPMLINVVRGDLSLVGPRPMEPLEVDVGDPRWRHVLSVRPGLISPAILHLGAGYNAAPAEFRLALEMKYVDQACGRVDARLLGHAAARLVRSRGNVKAR